MQQEEPSLRRYQVNVLVDNGAPGAPVVYADHPTRRTWSAASTISRAWERWSPTSA